MGHNSQDGRRRNCRPDRARLHAELATLSRLEGVWTLRAAIVDAGGAPAWEELEGKLRAAKGELGERTGVAAAIRLLTVFYTLHRMERIGYRGIIAAAEPLAARISELLGGVGGMSPRTLGGAARILERADIIDRWVYGRGRLAEDQEDAGPLPQEGAGKRRFRRPVSAFTLTVAGVSYWSNPPRRRRPVDRVGAPPTSANFTENSLPGEELASLALPGDARSISNSGRGRPMQGNAASAAVAADALELASGAGSAEGDTRARPVPARRYSWRPRPEEPNDLGHARQALCYDLETVLIRHRRRDRGEILAAVEAELAPSRWIAALERPPGVAVRSRGSGVDWSQWIWHWRDLPLARRVHVCTREILPAMLAHLRRVELWRLPQLEEVVAPGDIARAHISRGRCSARAPDPGPRMSPQAGRSAIAPPPPAGPPRRAAPPVGPDDAAIADWLEDLKRRRGGEEE